jgi:hypothetical protein
VGLVKEAYSLTWIHLNQSSSVRYMSPCRHPKLYVIDFYLRTDKYELPDLNYFIYCAEAIIRFLYLTRGLQAIKLTFNRIGVLYEPVGLVC